MLICSALGLAYKDLLTWETGKTFTDHEKLLLHNLKLNLQLCLPLGKYATSKLEDFKKLEDPSYNQQKFFDSKSDFIQDFLKEVNELPEYKYKPIDELDLFSEPDDSYKRYDLVKYYADAYRIAKLLDDEELEHFMNRLKHAYHMAYRICRKLNEYKLKHPFYGDTGMWEKDKKMNKIIEAVEKFRENS